MLKQDAVTEIGRGDLSATVVRRTEIERAVTGVCRAAPGLDPVDVESIILSSPGDFVEKVKAAGLQGHEAMIVLTTWLCLHAAASASQEVTLDHYGVLAKTPLVEVLEDLFAGRRGVWSGGMADIMRRMAAVLEIQVYVFNVGREDLGFSHCINVASYDLSGTGMLAVYDAFYGFFIGSADLKPAHLWDIVAAIENREQLNKLKFIDLGLRSKKMAAVDTYRRHDRYEMPSRFLLPRGPQREVPQPISDTVGKFTWPIKLSTLQSLKKMQFRRLVGAKYAVPSFFDLVRFRLGHSGEEGAQQIDDTLNRLIAAIPELPPKLYRPRTAGGVDLMEASSKKSEQEFFQEGLEAEVAGDKPAAILAFKSALVRDPTFSAAIAALGRLQFVDPAQPFLNAVHKIFSGRIADVTVEVRNPCNYRCFYCVAKGHNADPLQRFDLGAVEKIYAAINADVIVSAFECGGGEPTVHPQFGELVRLSSHYGAVSFPSNNSQDPERWLPKETASRLLIRSSLHPEAENTLDRYLKHARYLLDAGCSFSTTFIAHPTRLSKIPYYRELFAEHGVPFDPVPFIGGYEGRSYPHSHTEEEKQIIGLNEESRYWAHRIEPHAGRIRNFRGIPCLAGSQSLYISGSGILRRCMYDHVPLEKPLETATPCGVKKCGCGLFLEKLNTLNDEWSGFNAWSEKAGKPPVDVDEGAIEKIAADLGYSSPHDAMLTEQTRMYDALMAAYGKDEFVE